MIVNNGLGGSDTDFGLVAKDDTKVMGVTSFTNLDGVDTFDVTGTTTLFTGAVIIRNGNGGSNTFLDATAATTFKGGLTVINGAGDDFFQTGATLFTVGDPAARRNLTISNGTGEGGTAQDFGATTNTINGNLSVAATAGTDDLQVNGTNFNVLGSVGTGGSSTSISPAQIVNIDGTVNVTATEGQNDMDFDGATSVDLLSVTFSSGNGRSFLGVNGATTTATGTILHASGAGDRNTRFDAATTNVKAITSIHRDSFDTFDVNGVTSFASAAITIRNGTGRSNTFIDNPGTNTVNSAISIVNGDGFDRFQTGGTAFTLGSGATGLLRRNLVINNGTGGSRTEFTAVTDTINGAIGVVNGNGTVDLRRLTVTGATTLTTGNGDDLFLVESSDFNGLFRVTAGAGADRVLIEALTINLNDGLRCAFGAANINLGKGDDILEIGTDANDGADFAAAVSLVLNGGLDLDRFINVLAAANTGLPVFPPLPPFLGFEQFS